MPLPDYGYGNREARRKSQLVSLVSCLTGQKIILELIFCRPSRVPLWCLTTAGGPGLSRVRKVHCIIVAPRYIPEKVHGYITAIFVFA